MSYCCFPRLYTGQALSEWLFKPQKGGQGDADGETAQRRSDATHTMALIQYKDVILPA